MAIHYPGKGARGIMPSRGKRPTGSGGPSLIEILSSVPQPPAQTAPSALQATPASLGNADQPSPAAEALSRMLSGGSLGRKMATGGGALPGPSDSAPQRTARRMLP